MSNYFVQIVADALSTITILSSLFLKVPQIVSIRQKRSSEGIYIQAMLLEITGFSIMTLYNYTRGYSIMTYLEYPIILIQVYVMLFYAMKYKHMLELPIVPLTTITYVFIVLSFLLGILPKSFLSFMVPFCTPLSGFAKVTYIFGIIKAGNADAVSLTTWIISVITNVFRIFTVYVDSADVKLLANFVVAAVLSCGVLFTAVFFQQKTLMGDTKSVKTD